MFQLYQNIQIGFLGQIFWKLFQFKIRPLFGTPFLGLKRHPYGNLKYARNADTHHKTFDR